MINLRSNFINFHGKKYPDLDREKTVVVLGTSSNSEYVVEEKGLANRISYDLAKEGYNVVTGGGYGIMSAANAGAKAADPTKSFHADVASWIDKHPQKLSQRISLRSNATSRTDLFAKKAKYWIAFPGGPGSTEEITNGASRLYYNQKEKPDKIILVGRKFYKPLVDLYKNMEDKQLAKNARQVFECVDTEEEILNIIHQDQKSVDLEA